MKVSVAISRHIIVNDDVNMINVYSSTEDISGDQNSLIEFFEELVASNSKKCLEDLPFFLI